MAFEPGRRVGDQGEGRRMALGETIGAEALQLAEGLLGELGRIAALDHAVDQLVLEMADAAGELARRPGAPELVGLGGREDRKSVVEGQGEKGAMPRAVGR